jgi:FkbM family methyltransferase
MTLRRARFEGDLEVFCLNVEEARFVYEEIFRDQTYLRRGICVREGDCVFDVGANIGMFAIYLARRSPGIRLHCFEPIPEVFEALEANAELHRLDARLHEFALGEASGEARFTFYPRNSVMSGRHPEADRDRATTASFLANRSPAFAAKLRESEAHRRHADAMMEQLFDARELTCPVRTLSEVIESEGVEHVNLLKIDAEKSEHEVIAGIAPSDWRRIGQVVVEVHDIGGRLEELRSLLESKGFRVESDQDPLLAGTPIHVLYATR